MDLDTQDKKLSHKLILLSVTALALTAYQAFGAEEADMVEKLGDTAKDLLKGKAALVIDAIIIGASGFGAATMRSPAPVIFGLISVGLFHVAVKWITGA